MASTTFDLLTKRWSAQARQHGWPVTEVAQALGVPPSEMWARVWRGELRAIEVAMVTVIEPEELAKIGLL
jgi:lambda repressor-like predicted transcriptional regulator